MPSDEFLVRNKDPRPVWRRVDANAGLPLWEAMLFYGDQGLAKTVDDLTFQGFGKPPFFPLHEMPRSEQIEYNINSMRLEDARMRMEFEFQQMLKSGAVYATGYASHSPFDMPATRIVADRWRLLEANFDDSTAKGPNLEISGILVFDGSQASPVPIVSSKAFSVASLREWYGRWVSSNRQNGHLPSRDEDLKAARQALGESIPRSAVRRLRQELAPETWKQPRFFALRKFALFISVDRDHLSKMTILSGHDVDAAERLTELAELLAAGLMRLQARKSSELSDQNGENSLHYDASQRGRANLVSPEVTA